MPPVLFTPTDKKSAKKPTALCTTQSLKKDASVNPGYFRRRPRLRSEKKRSTITPNVAKIRPKYCNADICPDA